MYYIIPKRNKQICAKGQMKLEYIFEIIDFPKYRRKNLIDFCPGRFYRLGTCDLFWLFPRQLYLGECITYLVWINFQGRNLSNFLVVFWKIDDFINTFWLYLTFSTQKEFCGPILNPKNTLWRNKNSISNSLLRIHIHP